ncbi:MAG TPA: hypothetical protein VM934_04440 [Pyrinomonadaceae bacterium]|nr:hypothetical protein [Pyrinomonadaceae bacterium]
MNTRTPRKLYGRAFSALSLSTLLLLSIAAPAVAQQSPALPASAATQKGAATSGATATASTPTDTVRAFYKAFRERRFRDAWALTIFRKAVEDLKPDEFEELRPDFERLAAAVRPEIEVVGEQLSGNTATVFARVAIGDDTAPPEPVNLMRANDAWIIGDEAKQEEIKKKGKRFFFDERIETHHAEVQAMMQRIIGAEIIYASQHGGMYTDLDGLIHAGLVPQDLKGTETTGYRFHIAIEGGGKAYVAGAEPARYGRTGLLSFYLDQFGLKSKDTGGKPFKASPPKK